MDSGEVGSGKMDYEDPRLNIFVTHMIVIIFLQ